MFAFELRGRAIGTLRLVPVTHGLTLTEQLLENIAPDFRERWPAAWEAGRLVVAPEYRVGQDALKRCLHLSLLYMFEHVEVQNLVGCCTHVLSRLYRRFGFSVIAKEATLPGLDKTYALIHGEAAAVHAALSAAPAHAAQA